MEEESSDRIDWHRFWRDADEEKRGMAATGQYGQPDRLERFFGDVHRPDTVGSFGCGPAHCELTLAERYPDIDFYCYDTAPSVVAENRERVEANREGSDGEGDLENVQFGVETLPAIETERQFDLVYCLATLFYVPEVERAVENLYERVESGGYLVFDYPNRLTVAAHRRLVEDDPDVDTEWFRKRYSLVLERENLLSYDRIHDLLGRWPRSYASVVDDSEARSAPQVYVPK